MLNIGLGELIVVLLIAYVIVGPRDLPRVGRWLGRCLKRIRQLNREFRTASGWDDFVSASDDVRREMKSVADQTGLSGVEQAVQHNSEAEERNDHSGTDRME